MRFLYKEYYCIPYRKIGNWHQVPIGTSFVDGFKLPTKFSDQPLMLVGLSANVSKLINQTQRII